MEKFVYTFGSGGRLYMITFQFDNRRVICNDAGFKEALQRYDKTGGIKSVKWLSGDKWIRATKAEIRQWLSYDTETDLYLEEHYYFKTSNSRKR